MLTDELPIQRSTFSIEHSAKRSMAHLRTSSVFSLRDKRKADFCPAVWALGSNGHLIQALILVRCQTHQLKALGPATDLRCHGVPRTLRVDLVIIARR